MTEDCPVCGDPIEYREEVTVDAEGGPPGTTIDVDALCGADPDARWNRICPVASPAGDGPEAAVRLDVYRHHWRSAE